MVYNYKRKTDRANWSEASLGRAMQEAQQSSILNASKMYGIPYATLFRHVKSGTSTKKLGRFTAVFTKEEEEELVAYTQKMDSLFYGLTRVEFLYLVGEYAKKLGKEGIFKENVAGKGWFKNFKLRFPNIVLRTPEPTSIARLKGFNREAVERFYTLLEELMEKYNITPEMIFNMDETGVRTSSNKPPKILSTYGKKQVGVVASNEKGVLTTVICCCNVTGNFLPPFFIFKRKRFDHRLLDGSPPGSEASTTDSGWISAEKFYDWLQMFVNKIRPTKEKKALLLLDNHESHKNYAALEFATNNNVIFLSIPPHTSHKLQPLDVSVYGPLKKYFEIEVNAFQKAYPGRIISQYDVAKIFTGAYLKAATPGNAISGFRASGIFPFNKHLIGDEHFEPSEVYQSSENLQRPQANNHPAGTSQEGTLPREDILQRNDQSRALQEDSRSHVPIRSMEENQTVPQGHILQQKVNDVQPEPLPEEPNSVLNRSYQEALEQTVLQPHESKAGEETLQEKAGGSQNTKKSFQAILEEIRPIPAEKNKKVTSKGRKKQKSEILTSTPIKEEQKRKHDAAAAKKKVSFEEKPGPSNIKKRRTREFTPKTKEKENHPDYYCTVCKEKYSHPPREDWIQCDTCRQWTHEACSSYMGLGSYFCDDCDD